MKRNPFSCGVQMVLQIVSSKASATLLKDFPEAWPLRCVTQSLVSQTLLFHNLWNVAKVSFLKVPRGVEMFECVHRMA